MVRNVLGVIVAYVVMVVFIMASFSLLYIAMGEENAYLQNSFDVSTVWIVASGILGLLAAIIAGFVCKMISTSGGTVKVFAGIILVFGFILGVVQMMSDKPNEVRTENVSNLEAMQKSQQPLWLAFLNPVIGAIGIMIGGRLKKGD